MKTSENRVVYPKECMRGITKDEAFFDDGLLSSAAFIDFQKSGEDESVGEISVTWKDDIKSVRIILEQLNKNGKMQFKFGIAVLRRSDLDILKRNPQFSGILSYERKSTRDNPYHGNILMKSWKDKRKRNMVAAMLAMKAKMVFRDDIMRPEYSKNASSVSVFLAESNAVSN